MRPMMTIGLAFTENDHAVLMVKKTHPRWQAGRLNGVGGRGEPGEQPLDCVVREFAEETGRHVAPALWRHVVREIGPDYDLHAYMTRVSSPTKFPRVNDVGETLKWIRVDELRAHRHSMIGNLQWIVPMALDWRSLDPVTVCARDSIKERASW